MVVVLLLMGWIAWSSLHRSGDAGPAPSASSTAPATATPETSAPETGFAPFAVKRDGSGFTLAGELPDPEMKTGLLTALQSAFGPGAKLTDNLRITPGVKAPEFGALGGLFGATTDIPDFTLDLKDGVITLAGTATSTQVRDEVDTAAKMAWPGIKVVNNIQVRAVPR